MRKHAPVDALSLEHQKARDFVLAATLVSYPGDGYGDAVQELVASGAAADQAAAEGGWLPGLLASLSRPGAVDDLRSAYIDLLDRGPSRTSLYETEHGRMRGINKGNDLADIAAFYEAFGLTLSEEEGSREMPDHLSVELEFYALLLIKQALLEQDGDREGVSVVSAARKSFLTDHLGRLADAIGRTPPLVENGALGPVFQWTTALVRQECAALGVCPRPMELLPPTTPEREEDLACCGALPAKPPS